LELTLLALYPLGGVLHRCRSVRRGPAPARPGHRLPPETTLSGLRLVGGLATSPAMVDPTAFAASRCTESYRWLYLLFVAALECPSSAPITVKLCPALTNALANECRRS